MSSKNNKSGFPGESSFVVKQKRKGKFSNLTGIISSGNDDTGQIYIKLPDFTQMSCQQLHDQIVNMKEILSTPTFAPMDPGVIAAYENGIKTATAIYESKGCSVKTNGYGEVNQVETTTVKETAVVATDPVTKKETVIGTVKNELTSVTSDVSKTVSAALKSDTAKKAFPWVVVIAVVGVGYLIFRK